MASEIRVNKIENRSGLGTVTFADTGVDLAGIVTATTFSGSGASLTNIPDSALSAVTASKLTGALPAISGASLTGMASTDNVRTGILDVAGISTFRNTMNVGAAVTISESGIEASGIGITCANINGTQIGGRRNLIINGAMNVAQRATSSTSGGGYNTVDRIDIRVSGADETPTQEQADVASGTSPYAEGFRKSYKITNGNQTGGAGTGDYFFIFYQVEGQDIVKSGWNYVSPTSFITLSFWVKSSVAQNYYGYIRSRETTEQSHAFDTGSLSANTWTKVVRTFPGNSNIVMANDNGQGLGIYLMPFMGTDNTANSKGVTAWSAYSNTERTPDFASSRCTTIDATFEITGLQLEVGPQATAFEHRSIAEELALCQRYYEIAEGEWYGPVYGTDSTMRLSVPFKVTKRADPTLTAISTDENCCSSVSVVGANYDSTLGARVQGNNVFLDGANRHFSAKFSADSEL